MSPASSVSAARSASGAEWDALLALARKVEGGVELQVRGQSMGKALPDGVQVRIVLRQASDAQAYGPGEVALFRSVEGKRLVAHRVVRGGMNFQRREYVITRGDDCYLCDAPLNLEELLGTVVQVRRSEDWEAVPPPGPLPRWKRRVASLAVVLAAGWAFCSTPLLRRRLSLFLWRLRGSPQLHE